MLNEVQRAAIEKEAGHYQRPEAACIEALKIVQHDHGWVSDESIRDIADALEMSPHEVDSVATFYNLVYRRPTGRRVIHLCDSVSCWVMGCDRLCRHMRERLATEMGGTTEDGRFTLLPIACLGACDHAPAMMIDGELHTDLTPEAINQILENHP